MKNSTLFMIMAMVYALVSEMDYRDHELQHPALHRKDAKLSCGEVASACTKATPQQLALNMPSAG